MVYRRDRNDVFTLVGTFDGLVFSDCWDFFDENESVRVIRVRSFDNDDDDDHLDDFCEDIVSKQLGMNEWNEMKT